MSFLNPQIDDDEDDVIVKLDKGSKSFVRRLKSLFRRKTVDADEREELAEEMISQREREIQELKLEITKREEARELQVVAERELCLAQTFAGLKSSYYRTRKLAYTSAPRFLHDTEYALAQEVQDALVASVANTTFDDMERRAAAETLARSGCGSRASEWFLENWFVPGAVSQVFSGTRSWLFEEAADVVRIARRLADVHSYETADPLRVADAVATMTFLCDLERRLEIDDEVIEEAVAAVRALPPHEVVDSQRRRFLLLTTGVEK